jgi:hypothetical protein
MRRAVLCVVFVIACTSSTPTVIVPPPPPVTAAVQVTAGNAQTGVPGYRLAAQVTVKVVDSSGKPMSGVSVAFAPTDSTGAAEPATATTDSTGSASTFWRLGGSLGAQHLTASVPALPAATLNATATSNTVLAIDGGSFNGYFGTSGAMCAINQQLVLGCWALPHPGMVDPPAHFAPVSTPVRFTQLVMVGTYPDTMPNACALATTGRIWCFSLDSLANVTAMAEVPGSYPPLSSIAGPGFNDQTYCGLTAAGAAWCWGAGLTPAAIATPTLFRQIVPGDGTTCGLAIDMTAWCWGNNQNDQAGTPPVVFVCGCIPIPTQVSATITFTRLFNTRSDGASCGLATSGGVYCWGELAFGMAPVSAKSPIPTPQFAGGPPVVDVAMTWYLIMALGQDGTITVGGNSSGRTYNLVVQPHISGVLSGFLNRNGFGWACGPARGSTMTLCISEPDYATSPVIGVPFP